MSDIVTQRNIGALLSVATSVAPQSATASVNGTSIDRQAHSMAGSCVLHTVLGADSGSPSALSVQSKVQHSPDNSTWSDYKPDGVNVAEDAAALTAASTEQSTSVDLTAAARYIRAVTTISFTGGTSPAVEVATDVILGGENTLPAV